MRWARHCVCAPSHTHDRSITARSCLSISLQQIYISPEHIISSFATHTPRVGMLIAEPDYLMSRPAYNWLILIIITSLSPHFFLPSPRYFIACHTCVRIEFEDERERERRQDERWYDSTMRAFPRKCYSSHPPKHYKAGLDDIWVRRHHHRLVCLLVGVHYEHTR